MSIRPKVQVKIKEVNLESPTKLKCPKNIPHILTEMTDKNCR